MLSLLLSIILPIVIVLVIITVLAIFFISTKKQENATKGTLLFELDIRNRKIKSYDRVSNQTINRYIFNHVPSEKWISLSELTKSFNGTAGEKKFRNALVESLKDDVVRFSFTSNKVIKNANITFNAKINKINDADVHVLSLTWHREIKTEEFNIKNREYTKLQLADNPAEYKGFIGFALDSHIPNIKKIFTRQLTKVLRFRNSEIFFAKGLACIPVFGKDRKSVQRRMNKYIKIITNRGYRMGISRLTFGSAQILSKDVNTPKRVNVVLKTLDFLVNLSIRHEIDFITRDSEEFTDEEYKVYVEAAQVFRQSIRSGDIKSVPISVRKYGNKRKVIEYVVPTIENISSAVLLSILRNDYNRTLLIDAQAKKLSVDHKLTKPSLFDVNAEWLIANKDKISVKKAIYVVNFPETTPIHSASTINALKEKGFIFALRVKNYNEQVATLVMRIKPQFIVIDSELASNANSTNYIQLVSIKQIAENEGVKIIFENPSPNIAREWAEKISLDFYYEF